MFSSFRKKDKDKSEKTNAAYEHPIMSKISGKLSELEDKFLQQNKKNDISELNSQSKEYKIELMKTASRLSKISSFCFQNVEIDDVKIYKNDSAVPENYKHYLQVQKNLTQLIVDDINGQQDLKHTVMHLERWVYISKLCFEKNDYYTAGAITYAISSVSDNLIKLLSDTAQSIVAYNKKIYVRQAKLHILQSRQSEVIKNVIPLLSTLANIIANAEERGSDLPKVEFDAILKDCKKIYLKMKNNHQGLTLNVADMECVNVLKLEIDPPKNTDPSKSKKMNMNVNMNMNKLAKSMNIYANEDLFYVYAEKFDILKRNFNEMVTTEFTQTDLTVHHQISKILDKSNVNDEGKIDLISTVLEENIVKDSKLSSYCKDIISILVDLSEFKLKRLSLEPRAEEKTKQKVCSKTYGIETEKEKRIRSAPSRMLTRSYSNVITPKNAGRRKQVSINNNTNSFCSNNNLNNTTSNNNIANITINPNHEIESNVQGKKSLNRHSSAKETVSINLTVNLETNDILEKDGIEISIQLPKYNQGLFANIQNQEVSVKAETISKKHEGKILIRSYTNTEKVTIKSQSTYEKTQLPGLLLINDDQRSQIYYKRQL